MYKNYKQISERYQNLSEEEKKSASIIANVIKTFLRNKSKSKFFSWISL